MSREHLITGASRGIGAALAQRLLEGGDAVTGIYRTRHDEAQALTERFAALQMHAIDLGSASGIEALAALSPREASEGSCYASVVLNAGIAMRAGFEEAEVDGVDPIREQLRVDLESPLLCLRALLRAKRLGEGSSVVFVSSNLSRHGLAGKVAYSAAKAGLEGATRSLAKELGPAGVRVNAVAPGLLQTEMTAALGDEGYAAYAQEVPLRRVGRPEDVAAVIEFLVSEGADYLSGQVIDVDGGWGC